MIKNFFKILLNRNVILISAVVLGLTIGENAMYLKPYTTYILIVTMLFSMTGLGTSSLFPLRKVVRPMMTGTFLNYFIFGFVIILLAWILMPDDQLFYGFVVIAAAPPGVAIVPFAGILKGDIEYSIIGVFGAFLAAIVITPIVIGLFSGFEDTVNPAGLIFLMVKLIIVPLVLSRLLLIKAFFPTIKRIRGKMVDVGFALIIFTAVGMNSHVFFQDYDVLLLISLVLLAGTFGIGSLYEYLLKRTKQNSEITTSQILLLTIKSSGFSVVTALTLFGEKAAIPSAVLAVIVLLYLLFLSSRMELKRVFKR
ncbi:MAG: bile acid:sodium symporter family protein [Bacteroidota bacterium]